MITYILQYIFEYIEKFHQTLKQNVCIEIMIAMYDEMEWLVLTNQECQKWSLEEERQRFEPTTLRSNTKDTNHYTRQDFTLIWALNYGYLYKHLWVHVWIHAWHLQRWLHKWIGYWMHISTQVSIFVCKECQLILKYSLVDCNHLWINIVFNFLYFF